jgi:primosomal protein N' (replication factor Y)
MQGERTTLFVEVILPLPIQKVFTYRVPNELNDEVLPGKRVAVYFGGQKVYAALIRNIRTKPPEGYSASYLLQVLDSHPLVSEREFLFWEWMSRYYMAAIGDIMNAALPAGLKLKNESKILPSYEEIPADLELNIHENTLLDLLEKKGHVPMSDIATVLESESGLKVVKSLHDKGLIQIVENIKERYQPKMVRHVSLVEEFVNEAFAKEILDSLEKSAPKQVNVLLALLSGTRGPVAKSELIKKHDLSTSAVSTLVKKGLITETLAKVSRLEKSNGNLRFSELTDNQMKAKGEILNGFKSGLPVLLKGDTFSGKSYIFSDLAKQYMDEGKQVLYLLPEVALTQEFHRKLETYFGKDMVSVHSKFSQNEVVEIWEDVKSGKAKLIVGPRNAVFMPFRDLGLIIIDEEHENSYKQSERSPRFNGKDVALYLSTVWKANIILGSATPSIESTFLGKTGKYHFVELESTYHNKPAPIFKVIDTAKERKAGRMDSFIGDELYSMLKENMEAGNQSIIFQNRKGYVPITECDVCNWTQRCINCDITLTYYKYSNNLRCHYCGHQESTVSKCPDCGSTNIHTIGAGTEKISEELQILFPEANIARFDQESTRGKNKVKQLIDEFNSGEIDMLVGTQIIAKGINFENVQLAAVVQADQLLNFPDFRSFERAYQLMVQLSGRVGSENKAGTVAIQVSRPEHPIIKLTTERDYQGLYNFEIKEREEYTYPPFSRLILVQVKHKMLDVADQAALQIADFLKKDYGNLVLGPESPHISRIRNQYIKNILIKMDRNSESIGQIKRRIEQIAYHVKGHKDYRTIRVVFNVDPQ